MGKLFKNKDLLILILFLAIGFSCLLLKDSLVKAQEQIKIFPTAFSGDWQNPQAVFLQDLSEKATFEEFNTENSAYPFSNPLINTNSGLIDTKIKKLGFFEKIKNLLGFNFAKAEEENSTPIPEPTPEPTPTPTPELTPELTPESTPESTSESPPESTPTETPIIQLEKVLELSNFGVPEDFNDKKIQNVQLRLSFAAKPIDNLLKDANSELTNAKVSIEWFNASDNSWVKAGEIIIDKEISNAINGGYFLYALPIFESWDDLVNLKIRFIYQGQENTEIYLDSVWLEIDYQSLQEPSESREIQEEELTQEPTPSLKPSLKERKLNKEIKIDKNAEHFCSAKNFPIDLSGKEKATLEIELHGKRNDLESLEIGSLPLGIDITFLNNGDYTYLPKKNEESLILQIVNQPGSQKGNFNIPIIYTSGNSTTICQINVINF